MIVAPSPKGQGTCELLLSFIHAEFARAGLPADLVQMLPSPVSKAATARLMRQADLIVATGSQANVRMAYHERYAGVRRGCRHCGLDHRHQRSASMMPRRRSFAPRPSITRQAAHRRTAWSCLTRSTSRCSAHWPR
ncbi:hypothetical protein ACTMU2_40090 [Cupriavidus basilensis]